MGVLVILYKIWRADSAGRGELTALAEVLTMVLTRV